MLEATLAERFTTLDDLPAYAQSRDAFLQAFTSPGAHDIVAAVETDVALVVAVLRLAGERHGATNGDIPSVAHAVNMLDGAELEACARAIPVFDPLEGVLAVQPGLDLLRLHASAAKAVAERLAEKAAWRERDELVAATLLHDIGKLALPRAGEGGPEGRPASTPEERVRAEREELGTDHAAAGAALARRWGLSERLAQAIEDHHEPGARGLAAMVRLADLLLHHAHGRPVELEEVVTMSAAVGLGRDGLGSLLYDGAQPFSPGSPCPLSEREHEILRRLATGGVYRQIAGELGISSSTVRNHLHRIYVKLGTVDRAQAVLMATEQGWI